MYTLIQRFFEHKCAVTLFRNWRIRALSIAIIAVLGTLALTLTHAATPATSVEPESGTISGATISSDSTASGGKAVTFGHTPTYYVATSGSDAADGSMAMPWKSIQHAVSTAPSGSIVQIASGTYAPFSVSRPNLQVLGAPNSSVTIVGASGVKDVVLVTASGVTLSNFKVSGCVPASNPSGGLQDNGSSGVRVDDGTSGVTVEHLTISDSDTTLNSQGRPFGCYGILIHNATGAIIDSNDVYHNGYGVQVVGTSGGVIIQHNQIHDNDVIIRDTAGNDDDFGAVAIGFATTSGLPGPIAQDNTLYNNQGLSSDYGTDGGGFEIFNASNLTLRRNTIYNNENILETGTSNGGTCANNSFTGNTASGKTAGSTITQSIGMILRCADHMMIDSNTFTRINYWVFDIEQSAAFGGSINGLTITNNTVDQTPSSGTTSEKTFSLNVDPASDGLHIDNNHYRFQNLFANDWHGNNVTTLPIWQSITGFDGASTRY